MLKDGYKIRNTVIVGIVALLFLLSIVFMVFFPTFYFNYNKHDKSENFFIRTINQKRYLQLKLKGEYPFNKIVLTTNFKKKSLILGNVYQDELALYQSEKSVGSLEELKKYLTIDNSKLHNGQLVSYGESVFFIENEKYRAFADAETFDNFGFNWEKVTKVESVALHSLKKGEDITHATIYLDDLFVKIDNKFYYLKNNKKILIDNIGVTRFIESNFSIVNIDGKKLNSALIGSMICKEEFFVEKCYLKKNQSVIFPKAEILIEVKDKDLLKKEISAKVSTFNGVQSVVPEITIKNIKRLVKTRYENEIIKLKEIKL